LKVLVVDDHPLICEALGQVLQALDRQLELLEASTCAEALEQTRRNQDISLILLDLALPGVRVLSSGSYRTELDIALDITSLGHVVDAALRQSAIRDMAIEDAPLDEVIRALYADAERRSATS